jgi:GNAT superfamily N-acetyltransferase
MPQLIEVQREHLLISTDFKRLDLNAIVDMLSRAYWAQGRNRETIARAMEKSLVFGIYDGERQIGLTRVVTDYATFAWLCDVFIHEDYRGRGLGKWLMETVLAHPDLQELRRWILITRDAHGLYQQYGFTQLQNPGSWMEKFKPAS